MYGDDLDPFLAANVPNFFLKGMNEEQYEKLVKDERTPRPDNCEGLRVVRMDKMIWDVMSPTARSSDLQLQKCAVYVVKAETILASTVNKVVDMENEIKEKVEDVNLSAIKPKSFQSISALSSFQDGDFCTCLCIW